MWGEKKFFLLLNKVNGVGPKQSMKILSSARPGELASAIVNEDELFLTALPGNRHKGSEENHPCPQGCPGCGNTGGSPHNRGQ